MPENQLEADYLIIGAGAMGMAFVDELHSQDPHCSIVIVDRHASPGGHWNDAYPFVTLHQPALYYGVNSEPLGSGGEDLSSRAEILAYYERVLKKLLRSGRVQYFPQSVSHGGSRFRSLLEPSLTYDVQVRRKIVDATYMNVEVPSVRGPKYEVAAGAALLPINGLADLAEPAGAYVIIGGGKTGIDAVLLLLRRGVAPDHIHWVVPNDAWFLDRAQIQPHVPRLTPVHVSSSLHLCHVYLLFSPRFSLGSSCFFSGCFLPGSSRPNLMVNCFGHCWVSYFCPSPR